MVRKILASLAASIFGIVIALVLIEIGFRAITAFSSPGKKWNDRPKEYFIHELSETFQDYPYETKKPKSTYRVAVIGDSFTFAPYMQFDDAFPKRLERYLNLNAGQPKVEVINYGVPAYSTSHEVPVVRKAIEEGADLIVMQITFNDPEIKPYTPEALHKDHLFGELELRDPIYKYWTSLAFVKRRLHNNMTHENYTKKFLDLFQKKRTWKNFEGPWKTIAAIGKEKNIPIVSVVFPPFGVPMDDAYPFHPIHEKVRALMGSLAIPSLDLFREFEGIPIDRHQVMPTQDFHPNEIAHRVAAEAIIRWWREGEVVPKAILPRLWSSQRIGIRKPTLGEP